MPLSSSSLTTSVKLRLNLCQACCKGRWPVPTVCKWAWSGAEAPQCGPLYNIIRSVLRSANLNISSYINKIRWGWCFIVGNVKWTGKMGNGLTSNSYFPSITRCICSCGRFFAHKKQGRSAIDLASILAPVEPIRAGFHWADSVMVSVTSSRVSTCSRSR